MSAHEKTLIPEKVLLEKFLDIGIKDTDIYTDRAIDKDDIRQENALVALEAIGDSDQTRSIEEILSYAYNRVLWRRNNRLRDTRRRSNRPAYCSAPIEVLLNMPTYDQIPAEENERRQGVINLVMELSGLRFSVLHMRHLQGESCPFSEIAEELGISRDNAKVIAHRAYKQINQSQAGQTYRRTYLLD